MVALTSSQGILIAGIGLAFLIAGIAFLASRGRRKGLVSAPDIPNAMRPGPSDPDSRSCMSFSRTAPIRIGHAAGCSNT